MIRNCCSLSCGLMLSLATAFILVTTAPAQSTNSQGEELQVERVVDEGLVRIRIPARDGKVAWEDVLRALLRVSQLDDEALQEKFPSGELDLERAYSRYSLMAINLVLAPDIRMEIVTKTENQPAHLLVTVDEDAISEKRRRMRKTLREKVTGGTLTEGKYGLQLKGDQWRAQPADPLVIVVHGFNSSPVRFEPLAEAFRQAGLLSATYSYPDDQPIAASGRQLSADLKAHAEQFPHRTIYLVTHSMGGLVSRYAIEHPDLDPGTVRKLVMVAPPTHGSLLAHFGFGIDLIDQMTDRSMSEEVTTFYSSVEDGLSEAREDLTPDSRLLRELNGLRRNPQVSYSIFLGTGGHLAQEQVDRLRDALRSAADSSTTVRLLAPRYAEILADLDEVVAGKGDGVVAVKRGRLRGVNDVVLADFTHLGVLQTGDSLKDDEVFQGVLKRLAK